MSELIQKHKSAFLEGMRDGVPIGLGYFAVSFTLGIAAEKSGLNAWEGFLASALLNASAGEYAGFVGGLTMDTHMSSAMGSQMSCLGFP